jgi:beta-glucosidase
VQVTAVTQPLPYRDPSLPAGARTADLLSRMTVAEKCAQLVSDFGMDSPDGVFSAEAARAAFPHGAGIANTHHRSRGVRATVRYMNALQAFLRDETRLGIPALGFGEGLHGYMAHEATSFPQAIGLASAWDPGLQERVFAAVAREMRARGAHYVLSPMLDVARDPRWGRTEETYGEDPYLVARLGVAAVCGLQGDTSTAGPDELLAPDKVIATAKHFAAHGAPEAGANCAPANVAERLLREELLAPFEAAVREGGIGSVMASYNEINGIPSHVNRWLLGDVLRGEWGFAGLVVSDGWGVDDLYRLHRVAASPADAAVKAFRSGVEAELGRTFLTLEQAVAAGEISLAALDSAVGKVLELKFRLGLFENPFVDEEQAVATTNSAGHRALALEAARRCLVLLKNQGKLLPLDPATLNSIAVIGPNADALRLGGYSGDPGCGVTVLEGIRARLNGRAKVLYAEGCGITRAPASSHDAWFADEVIPADSARDEALIAEAVRTAQRSEVALLVLGDNQQTCREGWSAQHLGDRDSLDLPGRQEELLRRVSATGRPTVLLLLGGRPASIGFAAAHVPAILEGWYLGQATGTAVAEVLFGDTGPGGKLPITFPRAAGQIPAYYYHKPSARRGYVLGDATPLYPFGHGLGYTTFDYTGLRLSRAEIRAGDTTDLAVDVINTGERTGDEVIQLYIQDRLSSLVTRPVKLLKGFRRITLAPGESRTVTFRVGPEALEYLDEEMRRTVEPGEFALTVGGSSETRLEVTLTVV